MKNPPRQLTSGKFIMLTSLLIGLGACADGPVGTVQQPFGETPPTSGPPSMSRTPTMASLNAGGVETYTQVINSGGGFGQYVYWQGSFGWQHTFPLWNTPGVTITSAKLMIEAYDVDSEPFHGSRGEYDAIYVDGTRLNPGFLQGANGAWTTTTFDVPVSAITDNGLISTYIDIDINTRGNWATQVGSSRLVITYTTGPVNGAPFQPTLIAPAGAPSIADGLSIAVTGPTPSDPDGDAVTYEYRWFLNTGSGGYLDPQFHGRGAQTGSTVPASATRIGDLWRVQVTPRDALGAIGAFGVHTFAAITPVLDSSAPVLTPSVVGALGTNSWYTSDVTISWTVTDAQSAVTSQSGCAVTTIGSNTPGTTYTCIATSTGGTATQSVTVMVDKTAPTITGSATGTQGTNGWFTGDVAVAFSASDDISGTSSTAACDVTHTTDAQTETYSCTTTNGAGLTASASVSLKRDASAPVVTHQVVGTLGDNGWYTGDVTVSFSSADAVSGIASPACAAGTLNNDAGSTSFSCTATNGAGLNTTDAVTVKRDATQPVVSISGLRSYNVDETVNVTCAQSDAMSGIAASDCDNAAGAAYTFALGSHDVSASATDNAGNSAAASGSFSIEVAPASVCTLVRRWVSKAGNANALCQKLDAAAAGNGQSSVHQLDAFINQVEALSGKSIAADKAAILIALARALQ